MNIHKLLKKFNMPVAYMKFKEKQKLPYIVYYSNGSNNFMAEDIVYYNKYNYTIEYYYDKKKTSVEKEIENIFNENEVLWEKTEDIYVSSENIYLIKYFI